MKTVETARSGRRRIKSVHVRQHNRGETGAAQDMQKIAQQKRPVSERDSEPRILEPCVFCPGKLGAGEPQPRDAYRCG